MASETANPLQSLFVVYRSGDDLLPVVTDSDRYHRPRPEVLRINNLSTNRHLTILLINDLKSMTIDLPIGTSIRLGITNKWIIFPVEFTRPFDMQRRIRSDDAVSDTLYLVPLLHVDDSRVLHRAGRDI